MKGRPLFGPLLLIAVGVVWLLVSAQVIPAGNLWALSRIWPYVLIAFGVGILLNTLWAGAARVVSVLIVLGAVLAVVFAPQLGWANAPDWNFDGDFGGSIPGSGNIKTETREVEDFQSLAIEYPAQIIVAQGESESLRVEADDNVLPQLSTEVREGTLYIENKERDWSKRVDPSEPVKITITVKDLNRINFASAGALQVENLETEELRLVLSGAGEVTLNDLDVRMLDTVLSGAGSIKADGTADDVKLTVSGFGSLDAPDLTSTTATVRISGAGSATLRVTDELNATVSGAGSVNYLGSPNVDKNITGAGSVSSAGD